MHSLVSCRARRLRFLLISSALLWRPCRWNLFQCSRPHRAVNHYVRFDSVAVRRSASMEAEPPPAPVSRQPEELEDSDDEDIGTASDIDTAAHWLRKACARPRGGGSLESIMDFLSNLDADVAAAVVSQGNRNGKTPLHFTSQIRGDDSDGVELVDQLISYGADVNCVTARGHTPLIFAAGRGHSRMVRTLLQHGANPRVVVVTGDTAVSMGRGRVDEQTLAILEAAEADTQGSWVDFRNDSKAVQAQAEHMKQCPHCRRKFRLDEKEALAREEQLDQLARGLSENVSAAFAQDGIAATEAVARVLAETSKKKQMHVAVQRALRSYLRDTGLRSVESMREVFGICREGVLGRTLHQMGHRDRRSIRLVLAAVLAEAEATPGLLDRMSVAEILDCTDCHFAMELLRLKNSFVGEDQAAVEHLWAKVQELNRPDQSSPEVSLVCGRQLSKQEGGPPVARMLRRLQWACHIQELTPKWAEMVDTTIGEAARSGRANLLLQAVMRDEEDVPTEVVSRLRDAADKDGKLFVASETLRSKQSVTAEERHLSSVAMPKYVLDVKYEWASGDNDILSIRADLESMMNSLMSDERLFVGVDTEWGELGVDEGSAPSIVQVAARDRAWIIDTSRPTHVAKSFFRWLFSAEQVLLLGFSFYCDAEKISALIQDEGTPDKKQCIDVLDLQTLAMQHLPKGRTPGLRHLAEAWLGRTLDKTEQCSDWDRRPLTTSQLLYAAADAFVLLELASEMGIVAGSAPRCRPPRWPCAVTR